MSKEETPVEWLEDQYIKHSGNLLEMRKAFDQAKQMEEENLERLKDFDTWKEWKNKPSK